MRKILSGLLFRLFKGFEIWGLIALLLFAAGYIDFSLMDRENYLNLVHEDADYVLAGEEEYNLEDGGVKAYRFETQGVSALDVYKYGIEELPEDVGKILNGSNYSIVEMNLICFLFLLAFAIPMVLMTIFIPVFFGRMFSDGTIKNIVACGYGKRKIYLSALILTAVLDLTMILLSLITLVVICICLQWQPPVYLPVLITAAVISTLLLITITSVSLAAMFAGGKKTLAFVAGFIMFAARLLPVSVFSTGLLWYRQSIMNSSEISEETIAILKESGRNGLERKIDLSQFIDRFYVNGKEIQYLWKPENALPPVVCKTLIAISYMDPYLVDADDHMGFGFSPYLMYRDGVMAINIASNIFWIVVINGLGLLVVNKRELHC